MKDKVCKLFSKLLTDIIAISIIITLSMADVIVLGINIASYALQRYSYK